jgi:hypothetical protein
MNHVRHFAEDARQVWHRIAPDSLSDSDDSCELVCSRERITPRRTAGHIPPSQRCAACESETTPMQDNLPALHGGSSEIAVARPPAMVLSEAKEAAAALKTVLDQKPNKVMFNNEQYLEAEDWILLGRFYGITGKVDWTRPVTFGDVSGFEARAVAIRADGLEISAAEAMCLNDEEKWRARPKYAWCYVTKSGTKVVDDPGPDAIVWIPNPNKPGKKMPQKERTLIGEETVPLFQLRSMAQTRALAKVLANVLRWVPVLAGYKGTPAEEMSGDNSRPPRDVTVTVEEPETITKAELKRLQEHAQAAGHSRESLLEWLGVEKLTEVRRSELEAIMLRVDNTTPLSEPVEGLKADHEISFDEPATA